jgi:GNAT superfamily N-acetyltransferase
MPSLTEFQFIKFSGECDSGTFECGIEKHETDISEFLQDDAMKYHGEQFANTYVFIDSENTIAAYFCISNDCLNDQGYEPPLWNKALNKFHKNQGIPNQKRIRAYPSIKIGRLGVHSKYKGTGVAYELMAFIKGYAIQELKPACRLLLLDAVNLQKQITYYQRNGFVFVFDNDENAKREKRLMYYDLKLLE